MGFTIIVILAVVASIQAFQIGAWGQRADIPVGDSMSIIDRIAQLEAEAKGGGRPPGPENATKENAPEEVPENIPDAELEPLLIGKEDILKILLEELGRLRSSAAAQQTTSLPAETRSSEPITTEELSTAKPEPTTENPSSIFFAKLLEEIQKINEAIAAQPKEATTTTTEPSTEKPEPTEDPQPDRLAQLLDEVRRISEAIEASRRPSPVANANEPSASKDTENPEPNDATAAKTTEAAEDESTDASSTTTTAAQTTTASPWAKWKAWGEAWAKLKKKESDEDDDSDSDDDSDDSEDSDEKPKPKPPKPHPPLPPWLMNMIKKSNYPCKQI